MDYSVAFPVYNISFMPGVGIKQAAHEMVEAAYDDKIGRGGVCEIHGLFSGKELVYFSTGELKLIYNKELQDAALEKLENDIVKTYLRESK
jgi:hypothetical protein